MMKKAIVSILALSMTVATFAQKWAPVGENIKSPWAEKVDPAATLPEYPRPQMIREDWKNLNGLWNYAITSAEVEDAPCADGKILSPFSHNTVTGRLPVILFTCDS